MRLKKSTLRKRDTEMVRITTEDHSNLIAEVSRVYLYSLYSQVELGCKLLVMITES